MTHLHLNINHLYFNNNTVYGVLYYLFHVYLNSYFLSWPVLS